MHDYKDTDIRFFGIAQPARVAIFLFKPTANRAEPFGSVFVNGEGACWLGGEMTPHITAAFP